MPSEVIDALAGLNVAEAVFLAIGLFGSGATVIILLAGVDHLCPKPVHQAVVHAGHDATRAYCLLVLRSKQARDRARIALVAGLLIAAARLDSSSPLSQKGARR